MKGLYDAVINTKPPRISCFENFVFVRCFCSTEQVIVSFLWYKNIYELIGLTLTLQFRM